MQVRLRVGDRFMLVRGTVGSFFHGQFEIGSVQVGSV